MFPVESDFNFVVKPGGAAIVWPCVLEVFKAVKIWKGEVIQQHLQAAGPACPGWGGQSSYHPIQYGSSGRPHALWTEPEPSDLYMLP